MAQRHELSDQLERLQDARNNLSEKLSDPMVAGADRHGLEARIGDIDQRISAVDKQIAAADQQVAQTAGIPGAVVPRPIIHESNEPPMPMVLGGMFIFFCLFPLAIAWSRRLWRRGAAAVAAMPADLMDRISRLDQAVESIAIEVERIGEGQRFMTRVFTESGARIVGPGPAQPVELPAREAAPLRARNPGGPV